MRLPTFSATQPPTGPWLARSIVACLLLAIGPAAVRVGGEEAEVADLESPAEAVADPHSHRIVDYQIEARLDPEARSLTGSQVVSWRNPQSTPTSELWFHLYWNAFRNDASTWMIEDGSRPEPRSDRDRRPEDWGWLEVDAVELEGQQLSGRFASPDDGNPDDRTVWVVDLPQPVAPGERIEVRLDWRAQIPRTFARTGYRGDFFFVAHWFPKLGVYEPEGWNCHQFHAGTEFFSDYGSYDVRLTLPEEFVVGATGRRSERVESPDGGVTHRYRQQDVHSFTWTASPDYQVLERRFEVDGLPPVDMRLLLQPEHRRQADRHFAATEAALEYYGRWYGAYPYDHVTVVDPAFGSGAGGMEYPTIFTAGTRLFNPLAGGSPEGVTIHEAGHQFWYGLVGNNEFEHAWLDEGLNTFSTARVHDQVYGERRYMKRYLKLPGLDRGFFPLLFPAVVQSREVHGNRLDRFRKAARSDVQSTVSFRYDPSTGSRMSYDKTALWLATLERYLGWDKLQEILSTFFERYRFGHPRPEDLFRIASQVAGEDLDWYFDQVHRSAVTFDYAVTSVRARPLALEGWAEVGGQLEYHPPSEDPDATPSFRSEVVVRRLGEGVFPVEVLLVFDDGSEVRRQWDGAYPWVRFVEDGPARIDYAVVDPERVLLLDLFPSNNSRRREGSGMLAAVKWGSQWLIWLQDLLATFSFFASTLAVG